MQMIVRSQSFKLPPELSDYVQKRLEAGLRRFSDRIDRVMVLLTDVNGPKGGADQQCEMKVKLKSSGIIVAKATDVDIALAVGHALDRVLRQIKHRRELRLARRVRVERFLGSSAEQEED